MPTTGRYLRKAALNNVLVKLQDAQDNYVDVLEDETVIVNANSWYDAHDGDVFKFKQSVIEYLSKAKRHQSNEVNSVISSGSHCTRKSNHSNGPPHLQFHRELS